MVSLCPPVVKKPKPHRVSAMLAFAPKELALLMYMMTGEAAIVQAQLNRLNFCRLNNLHEISTKPRWPSCMQQAGLYLQPGNCHSQGSIIYINMIWRPDGILWFVCLFRLAAVVSRVLASEQLADIWTSIVALISLTCTVRCCCKVYTCTRQYVPV